MRYAYFPGCTLSSTGYAYDLSFKVVARVLGIDLIEVRDWVCCGARSPMRRPRTLCSVSPS